MTTKPTNAEEEFFARQQAELLGRLAKEKEQAMAQAERERLKALHHMHCPKCGMELATISFQGVDIDRCYTCNGTWLDEGELEALIGKDSGFLHRVAGIFKGKPSPS